MAINIVHNADFITKAALNVPADALMYMQTKYNLQTAREEDGVLSWLAKIPRIAALW